MPERTLSLRELNRAALSRQSLLARRRVALPRAVEVFGALQAQWPSSPYLALWTRLAGFRREELTSALERRRVVKAVLLRNTLHLVSARDFPSFARVMRDDGGRFWLRYGERRGLYDAGQFARLRERVLEYAAATPRRRAELLRFIEQQRPSQKEEWAEYHYRLLRAHRELVNVPPDGIWGNAPRPLLVSARAWLGESEVAEQDARAVVLRRYLAAYGPASRADLAAWTGLPITYFDGVIVSLGRAIARFRDEDRRELLDLARAPRPDADAPAPARYLPKWDSLLLAYEPRHRVRVLPERYRRAVIAVNGDVAPTFLLDGFVAGTWSVRRTKQEAILGLAPFGRLGRADRAALIEEGERLLRFIDPEAGTRVVR